MNLQTKRTSSRAAIEGAALSTSSLDFTNGINFSTTTDTALTAADALKTLFTIDVDDSDNPVIRSKPLKTVDELDR